MAAFVLGAVALACVVLSFAFAVVVLVLSRPSPVVEREPAVAAEPVEESDADGHETAPDTMARVLGEVERLAALRERGALTDKEFAAQKAKLLDEPAATRRTPSTATAARRR